MQPKHAQSRGPSPGTRGGHGCAGSSQSQTIHCGGVPLLIHPCRQACESTCHGGAGGRSPSGSPSSLRRSSIVIVIVRGSCCGGGCARSGARGAALLDRFAVGGARRLDRREAVDPSGSRSCEGCRLCVLRSSAPLSLLSVLGVERSALGASAKLVPFVAAFGIGIRLLGDLAGRPVALHVRRVALSEWR